MPSPTARAQVEAELPFLAVAAGQRQHRRPTTGCATGASCRGRTSRPLPATTSPQAERFVGVPYLWGGRSARGIDCSALVQLALLASGSPAPRDSDMQAALVGTPLAAGAAPRRGDLWSSGSGHVAIVARPDTLIHANGHHMAVAVEPMREVVARIAASGGGPVTVRRRP